MTPAQYTALLAVSSQAVPALMWLSKLPLEPLTAEQAGSLLALTVGIVGMIHSIINFYLDRFSK